MTFRMAPAIEFIAPRKRLPASFDEMPVAEFLELVQWWAALSRSA